MYRCDKDRTGDYTQDCIAEVENDFCISLFVKHIKGCRLFVIFLALQRSVMQPRNCYSANANLRYQTYPINFKKLTTMFISLIDVFVQGINNVLLLMMS